jgi:hypothetical protein
MSTTLLFRSIRLLARTAFVAVAFHSFVPAYEEPTLRQRFDADCEAYCRAATVASSASRETSVM